MRSRLPTLNNTQLLPQHHLFTNLTHHNDRFRILTSEYNKTMSALNSLEIFWMVVVLVEAVAAVWAIRGRVEGEGWIIFMAWFIGVLQATILAVMRRKHLKPIVIFSGINLTLYLLTCTILMFTHKKFLIIPTSIYMCVQILASLFFLQNRRKVFTKFLLMLQLLLIILKLDNKIVCEWLQVYFGFVLTAFIGYVIMLSMLIFFVVNLVCFKQSVRSVKHKGIGFVFLNSCCAVLATIIPISQDFYHLNTAVASFCAIFLTVCYFLYGRVFRSEIIMFLCRVEKVKSFNQIITLVKLPPDAIQPYVFFKKSENWYQKTTLANLPETPDKKIPTISMTPDSISQNKCLICFQLDPCFVWMPCGHLAVCQICCDRILESKNCNCLLCKDQPEAIYHVYEQKQDRYDRKDDEIRSRNQIELQGDADSKANIRQLSTKDLDVIEASLSGSITVNSSKNMRQESHTNMYRKNEILFIRNGFSIKIN